LRSSMRDADLDPGAFEVPFEDAPHGRVVIDD
jgi:hypothetical protein